MGELFEVEENWNIELNYTIEPFIDNLEERGASSRETLELADHLDTFFNHYMDTGRAETSFAQAYKDSNPNGCSIHIDNTYLDLLSETGTIKFEADKKPDSEDLRHLQESLETALNEGLGRMAFDSKSAGGRLNGYEFRPTYHWEDNQLLIEEDGSADGPVMSWVQEHYGDRL